MWRNLDLCESETADGLAHRDTTYSQSWLFAQIRSDLLSKIHLAGFCV